MERLLLPTLGLLVVALVAWISGAAVHAQQSPTLRILSPKQGETISGDTVTVRWESSGVEIVKAADAKVREEGHFHLFVDHQDFRPGVEIPRDMEKEGIYHTAESSLKVTGLKPGPHHVVVVLSYNNHVPWEPLVTARVSFTTK